MGIKLLNHFLKENCVSERSMQCVHLSQLSGKTVAVDISIYMYKFLAEDALIENMYSMLSIFRYYNIIPVFIFDGKPPSEKNETLNKRKEDKLCAKRKFKQLSKQLEESGDMSDGDRQDIMTNMSMLKKQFVYVTTQDINNVKHLIHAFGTTYYEASGEADELCAMLVLKKRAWACLSEDMDLFVYGCPKVLRYLSLTNHTMVLYNTKHILEELGLKLKEFREICVLSGTDYTPFHVQNEELWNSPEEHLKHSDKNDRDLHTTLKYFKKYKKSKYDGEFYDWLQEQTSYIQDYELLKKIYNMFDLTNQTGYTKVIEKMKIQNGMILKHNMRTILEEDGFIFSN